LLTSTDRIRQDQVFISCP